MSFEEWLGSKMAIADIRDITSEIPDTINAAVECIAELAYKAGQMSCACPEAFEKKKVKKVVERWININQDGYEEDYLSDTMANFNAQTGRIACVKLTGEYEEMSKNNWDIKTTRWYCPYTFGTPTPLHIKCKHPDRGEELQECTIETCPIRVDTNKCCSCQCPQGSICGFFGKENETCLYGVI